MTFAESQPRSVKCRFLAQFNTTREAVQTTPKSEPETVSETSPGSDNASRSDQQPRDNMVSSPRISRRAKRTVETELHARTGFRFIPRFTATVGELHLGLTAQVASLSFEFTAVGLWGGKSADIGSIYTAGVGLRLTVWWRALERGRAALLLGPAADVVGLFGYGRGGEGVAAQQAAAPVVDLLLLVGGRFRLSPRTHLHLGSGGGWTVVDFKMTADGTEISGQSGGLVLATLGVDFQI